MRESVLTLCFSETPRVNAHVYRNSYILYTYIHTYIYMQTHTYKRTHSQIQTHTHPRAVSLALSLSHNIHKSHRRNLRSRRGQGERGERGPPTRFLLWIAAGTLCPPPCYISTFLYIYLCISIYQSIYTYLSMCPSIVYVSISIYIYLSINLYQYFSVEK